MAITYKDAGVDIDAGNRLVDRIRPLVAATRRPEVLTGLGGFAGLCSLPDRYRDPVLVSGTDGVGTKLKTAFATGRHDTIGIDLVAMSVNDILVTGAEPLLFLDYFATGALDVDVATAVVGGIAEGCKRSGCALVGGETAELPGLYTPGEYDLAGFCVGVVERERIRTGSDIEVGDVIIGMASAGLHSNGHSLARKVLLGELGLDFQDRPDGLAGASVADVLLEPTVIYVDAFKALDAAGVHWKAAAHITGGGLIDNPPRMFGDRALTIELDPARWAVPPVFSLIASAGVEETEMRRTFNLGLGMLLAVAPAQADAALAALRSHGTTAAAVGTIAEPGAEPVSFR